MRFEKTRLDEALGAIAGHTVSHGHGTVKKGAIFDAEAIEALDRAGIGYVFAARLEPGDVAENDAALTIAEAVQGPHTQIDPLATGRVNLRAERDGVALIDAKAVNAINGIYEGITVATLPAFERVRAGERVATIKLIPFAVAGERIGQVRAVAGGPVPVVAVAPFARKRAGLLLTRVPRTKAVSLAKSETVLSGRIGDLGGSIETVVHADHDIAAVAREIASMRDARVDLVVILGSAAIADRNDVVPAGLLQAGGGITHLGMPVEPGNLLMLGSLGQVPVIGAPSCARSPKQNGFDWVLQRLVADLDVGPDDIAAMGVGGLLLR